MKHYRGVKPSQCTFGRIRTGACFFCKIRAHQPPLAFRKTGSRQAETLLGASVFWFAPETLVQPSALPFQELQRLAEQGLMEALS